VVRLYYCLIPILRMSDRRSPSRVGRRIIDQLLANYRKPEDLTGEDGIFKQLRKAVIERALGAELTEHLGYEKGDPAGRGKGSSCNEFEDGADG